MKSENPLLEKLRKATNKAQAKEKTKNLQLEQFNKEETENDLKNKAQNLYLEFVTKEKLTAFANENLHQYPLLFIHNDKYRPRKNKKTGYIYRIDKLGEFLSDILIENGFEPSVMRVSVNSRTAEISLTQREHCYNAMISEPGWYLGIEW